jgi:hypothetical protein
MVSNQGAFAPDALVDRAPRPAQECVTGQGTVAAGTPAVPAPFYAPAFAGASWALWVRPNRTKELFTTPRPRPVDTSTLHLPRPLAPDLLMPRRRAPSARYCHFPGMVITSPAQAIHIATPIRFSTR